MRSRLTKDVVERLRGAVESLRFGQYDLLPFNDCTIDQRIDYFRKPVRNDSTYVIPLIALPLQNNNCYHFHQVNFQPIP
jgi:hypothetical protein